MSSDREYLLLAKCVLRDCPEFLSQRMIDALLEAGVVLPPEVRVKFQTSNPRVEAVRSPMNDP